MPLLCYKPITTKAGPVGCGQCMECRFNKRRVWTHRIMLESVVHEKTSFVTLTYNDENLPEGGSVDPRHLQLFLKRMRKHYEPIRVRFFGVGEYGDDTNRPHYHLALFGVDGNDTTGRSLVHTHPQRLSRYECNLDRSWDFGHVHVASLSFDSAQYIAGYVVKKLTKVTDERLEGRYPEFARMSLRPGIGGHAATVVAQALCDAERTNGPAVMSDMPRVLRTGRGDYPLGFYMRERIAGALGLVKDSDALVYRASVERLQKLQSLLADSEKNWMGLPDYTKARKRLEAANAQTQINRAKRRDIYAQRKKI